MLDPVQRECDHTPGAQCAQPVDRLAEIDRLHIGLRDPTTPTYRAYGYRRRWLLFRLHIA